MSKETLLLWGREFDLPIQMERYSDESIFTQSDECSKSLD